MGESENKVNGVELSGHKLCILWTMITSWVGGAVTCIISATLHRNVHADYWFDSCTGEKFICPSGMIVEEKKGGREEGRREGWREGEREGGREGEREGEGEGGRERKGERREGDALEVRSVNDMLDCCIFFSALFPQTLHPPSIPSSSPFTPLLSPSSLSSLPLFPSLPPSPDYCLIRWNVGNEIGPK